MCSPVSNGCYQGNLSANSQNETIIYSANSYIQRYIIFIYCCRTEKTYIKETNDNWGLLGNASCATVISSPT